MNIFWILLIIAIIAAPFAYYFFYLKPRKDKAVVDRVLGNIDIPNVPQNWANSEATPLGMRVIWNTEPFNNEAEKAIAFECFDIGFQNGFHAMARKFPTWSYDPALVNIGILEPTATNMDGSRALLTKHGVQFAGAVIGTGDNYPLLTIIIPSQKGNGWRYTDLQMRTIWHEFEHFMEFLSDTHEFMKWGRTEEFPVDAHPHTPLPSNIPEIPAPVL